MKFKDAAINDIQATVPKISKAASAALVSQILETLKAALDSGEEVRLSGIGTLSAVTLPAGTFRNPTTQQDVAVPARTKYRLVSRPRKVGE